MKRKIQRQIEIEAEIDAPIDGPIVPSDWIVGALLNVRANGAGYTVTLLEENFDYRHPERTLFFSNSWTCQDFISQWYARTYHDPRAK